MKMILHWVISVQLAKTADRILQLFKTMDCVKQTKSNFKVIHLIFVLCLELVSKTRGLQITTTEACDNAEKVDIETHRDYFTSKQATESDYFSCLMITDNGLPWPVDYTISLNMQSLQGSTPGIIFNYLDDSNYVWLYFLTGDYACVNAGQVKGNTNEDFINYPCGGNYLSDAQWYGVVVNVSSTHFNGSVNNWMVLTYTVSLSLAPSIGFTHRYGYEYWCSPDYQCTYNFEQPSITPRQSSLYTYTELKDKLQLPGYGTSTPLQPNLISVLRIEIDNAGQPADTYCIVSFFFQDYDIGVGELSIQGVLTHEFRSIETYSTNDPFIDVLFDSRSIDATRRGFSLEYEVLRCGILERGNIDSSYFCEDGNHINLHEDFYRSTANKENANFTDSDLAVGWYRFSSCAGENIPTASPGQEDICSTQYPIWMKDDVDGIVCLYKAGNECSEEWKIPVYDCPEFRIYYLTPSPENSGYCVGQERKCDSALNEFSLDGMGCEPCVDGNVPEITLVEIGNDWVLSFQDGYKLSCTIDGSDDTHALFSVEWLVDFGTHRKAIKQSGGFETAKQMDLELTLITSEYLQHHLICRAQSKYREFDSISDWHESQPVFIGMKIEGPSNQVSFKTNPIEVEVTFTLPISENTANCHIDILFATTFDGLQRQNLCSNMLYLQPDLVHLGTCAHTVNCADWSLGTKHRMRVKNTLQKKSAIYSKHEHTIYAVVKSVDNTIWNNIIVDTQITVNITGGTDQLQTSSCSSRNDPHFFPFNEKSNYDFHDEGEYVLYKSTPYEDRDMLTLVTVLQQKCHFNQDLGTGVACNKGVGIRVNGEAIFIDRTREQGDELQYIRDGTTVENGFLVTVDQSKTKYEIFCPRGEKVEVTLSGSGDNRYLNVRVNSRLEEQATRAKGNGLCGEIKKFGGHPPEQFFDLISRDGTRRSSTALPEEHPRLGYVLSDFGASWKADDSENIIGLCSLPPHVPRDITEMFTCKVDHWHDIVDLPTTQHFITRFVDRSWDVERCIKTSDRSTYLMNQLRRKPLSCDGTKKKRHATKRRQKTDTKRQVQESWTKENAYSYCYEQIGYSSTGKACTELIPEEVTTSVDQCVADILVTGSTHWTDGTLVCLREACKDDLYTRLDEFWTFETNSTNLQPPTIADNLCPKDCSAHGECVGGKCECYEGFIGADCSLSIETPPTLQHIKEGYICQYNERCDALDVVGNDFVSGDNLTCHFLAVEETTGAVDDGSSLREFSTQGNHFTLDVVICPWPSLDNEGGYTKLSVAVSNDGIHISDYLPGIAVSHSQCLTCEENEDGDVDCLVLDGFCWIENRCIEAMNTSSHDQCLICDPESASEDWTDNSSPECAKQPHRNGLAIWEIALIAVGCVIVLSVIVALLIKTCAKMKKVPADPRKYIRPDTPKTNH